MDKQKPKDSKEKENEKILDERTKMGMLLYDLQRFNIESRSAVLMNKRIDFYRGK